MRKIPGDDSETMRESFKSGFVASAAFAAGRALPVAITINVESSLDASRRAFATRSETRELSFNNVPSKSTTRTFLPASAEEEEAEEEDETRSIKPPSLI